MKLLQAHVDETLTRFRLLGPKHDAPVTTTDPRAQGEVSDRRDESQTGAADDRQAAWNEPPRWQR